LYARLGVKEYFVFDPEGCYLKPVLRGYRSVRRRPVPMNPAEDGSLVTRQLGLRLVPEGEMLGLIDLDTGQPVPTRAERAEALAAEVERLRALLARQRGKR
jgi:hypothetical protein